MEYDPQAAYAVALVAGDLIKAWKWTDDEGTVRWCGIPLGVGMARLVKTSAVAGAASTITANIVDSTGAETGTAITVNCLITGTATNLNKAIPRLANDDEMIALHINGKWYGVPNYQEIDSDELQVDATDGLQTKLDICT